MFVYVCMYVCSARGGQKRAIDSLEWELLAVLGCLMRVLRTDLESSGRALCALNHQVICILAS